VRRVLPDTAGTAKPPGLGHVAELIALQMHGTQHYSLMWRALVADILLGWCWWHRSVATFGGHSRRSRRIVTVGKWFANGIVEVHVW
jgi:hypothetical protein